MEGRPGQGRVTQGTVVGGGGCAASEAVKLCWRELRTVDSLSPGHLTSQGFFYIPAYGCVNLCERARMCEPKRRRKVCLSMCALHVQVT